MISEVNTLHKSGYGLDRSTGRDFFSGESIVNIEISSELQTDAKRLAVAGKPDASGDNSVALAIAQKQYDRILSDNTQTFQEYYEGIFNYVGSKAQIAISNRETGQMLDEQLSIFQESISGVSVDEEMANIIQFQRAFEATARFIKTIDEILQTLINM